jgi:hypothetical protein
MASAKLLAFVAGSTLLSMPVAQADGGDTSLIHACVGKVLGIVRIVRAGQHCHHSETPLHWPAQASAAAAGPRGVQLFESDGMFTVPAGVTSVLLEMWGAGGAAGLSTTPSVGGSGGGGAYLRHVVSVSPGQAIAVTIGQGGTAACGVDGGAGGDTTFGNLAMAGGGQGGTAAGQPGGGGVASLGGISYPGTTGFATGGFSVHGSFLAPARVAPGRGGNSTGPSCNVGPFNNAAGSPGQLIVQW